MTRPRWRLSDPGPEVDLPAGTEGYHYLSRVVRLRRNEEVAFFCGDGKDYIYRLIEADRDRLRLIFDHSETVYADPPFLMEIWIPNLKGNATEEVIRSVVPLGVTEIRVYASARAVVRPTKDRTLRRQKVADEAVRQCGRTVEAKVHPGESTLTDLLGAIEGKSGIIFHEKADRELRDVLEGSAVKERARTGSGLVVVTGPEGGFTDEEIESAEKAGVVAARLGRTVLRAELAPVVAATLIGSFLTSGVPEQSQGK
jgi:16S rRNA (uracil1498-N3)-methyltransferase